MVNFGKAKIKDMYIEAKPELLLKSMENSILMITTGNMMIIELANLKDLESKLLDSEMKILWKILTMFYP